MSFTIDEDSLTIKGRKGDSAEFTFNFDKDISSYTVSFYVKKGVNDTTALIEKTYTNQIGQNVTVMLTPADTNKLTSKANSYSTYFWGLRISIGNTFAQTLIPSGFSPAPMMYIYPEIGED